MSQYIGKTISLISNKQLRYVGVLDKISAEDATIALKTVRSFGTEGRLTELGQGNMEVPPGSDVYDYVVFRGSDVKDLTVLDVPLDQVQPANQPAAASAPAPAPAASSPSATEPQAPTKTTGTAPPAPESAPEPQNDSAKSPSVSQPAPGSRPQPKTGSKPQFDEEFDFETANAKFVKEVEHEKEGNTYNKSSFFDTLSSSNDDRGAMRWNEEKQLNYDTFGQTSVHRGRGRGRGRGGFRGRGGGGIRGRGRGRGRGKPEPKPEWA